jgi:hypothetical protein
MMIMMAWRCPMRMRSGDAPLSLSLATYSSSLYLCSPPPSFRTRHSSHIPVRPVSASGFAEILRYLSDLSPRPREHQIHNAPAVPCGSCL